jgi:hypothetical protein
VLGRYDNFPSNIHFIESFNVNNPVRQLQKNLMNFFAMANKQTYSFEEVANPTIPNTIINFEFGLAEGKSFCFIEQQELCQALELIQKENYHILDFYCAIQYHKGPEKTPLKFDYYIIRTLFEKGKLEVQIHHEKGPRYLSPEDIANLILQKATVN